MFNIFFYNFTFLLALFDTKSHVAQEGLELQILLPPPPKCWGFGCALQCLADAELKTKPRGFVHARQVLYHLSNVPPEDLCENSCFLSRGCCFGRL